MCGARFETEEELYEHEAQHHLENFSSDDDSSSSDDEPPR